MVYRHHIETIKRSEIQQAATTLCRAFREDSIMQWIFGAPEIYEKKAASAFETWVDYCVLYGCALKTENFSAVAIGKQPGDLTFSFWRLFRSKMYKLSNLMGKDAFTRLMLFDSLTEAEKKQQMSERPFWYFWMLGTSPDHQKQGYGSQLIQHLHQLAQTQNVPVYLETGNPYSATLYEKLGYKRLSEFTLPETEVKVVSMLKEFP